MSVLKKINKKSARKIWGVLRASVNAFIEDRALKMCAALSYYTVFAIAPLLIIIISLASFFYGKEAIQNRLAEQLAGLVGKEAAVQIQEIIAQVNASQDSTFAVIVGVTTLVIGATGVFVEIQDSLNEIWKVRAKPEKGWQKLIINRVLSFSMIIGLGFLLIVSLVINALIIALMSALTKYFPETTVLVLNGANVLVTFGVISVLFGTIFKFLPDVEISWKDVRMGAFFTALLFMLGKYVIGLYIAYVGPGSAYGAAGSIIVILVWVYYTSAILYFGAEFTQVYADCYGSKIRPSEYAVHVVQTEQEKEVKVLPPKEHPLEEKAKAES